MPLEHNFSLASSRDSIVHGATRPGFAKDNEVAGGVADQDVEAWCSFMKEQVSAFLRLCFCLLEHRISEESVSHALHIRYYFSDVVVHI